MANVRAIKQRIRSAKNISQITRAMELVSAAKMRKAQQAALQSRPYSELLQHLVTMYYRQPNTDVNSQKSSHTNLVIIIATSKGLCGSLNTQLFRVLLKKDIFPSAKYITLGKKAKSFIIGSGGSLVADFTNQQTISAIAEMVTSSIQKSDYQKVYIAYNHFHSALKQEPKVELIWPLEPQNQKHSHYNPLIEPNINQVSEMLFEAYIENKILSAWLEAQASEHSARMFTMKQANDSAKSFISDLSLEYNAIRQSLITSEIADLVTSRLAISI